MGFLDNLMGAGIRTIIAIRKVMAVLVILTICFFVIWISFKLWLRHKRNRNISEEQDKILHLGSNQAKKSRLRYLYSSNNNKKTIYLGRIISFIQGENNNKLYSIFVVKRGLDPYEFYKVKSNRHSKVFGDVTLYDWNFKLDEENKFYILNDNPILNYRIEKKRKEDEAGVDSIGSLNPIIHKAVQGNPVHRIILRLRKLIKVPDEQFSRNQQGVQQYQNEK